MRFYFPLGRGAGVILPWWLVPFGLVLWLTWMIVAWVGLFLIAAILLIVHAGLTAYRASRLRRMGA